MWLRFGSLVELWFKDVNILVFHFYNCGSVNQNTILLDWEVQLSLDSLKLPYNLFLQVPLKKESGQSVSVPLFQSQENISGKVYCLNFFFSMSSIMVHTI